MKKIVAIILMICLLLVLDFIFLLFVLSPNIGAPIYKHQIIIDILKYLSLGLINISICICIYKAIIKKDNDYSKISLAIIVFSIIIPIILFVIAVKVRDYDSDKGYYTVETRWKKSNCLRRDKNGKCIKEFEDGKYEK